MIGLAILCISGICMFKYLQGDFNVSSRDLWPAMVIVTSAGFGAMVFAHAFFRIAN